MELSIELLKTFVTVVDEMNFTRASKKLYKTQSAVSLQMKRLAEQIGKPLFSRNGKKLFLTETGEKLHLHSLKILKVHDEACMELASPVVSGTLNIGASEDYANSIIPRIIFEFAKKYPNVKVGLQCSPSIFLKEMLEKGLLDIAILAEHEDGGKLLKYEEVLWMASKSYVHTEKEVPLAVYPDYCAARNSATRKLREAGINYRVAYESQSMSLIKAAVEAGSAVAPVFGRVNTDGYKILTEKDGFPLLPHVPITLHKRSDKNKAVTEAMEDYIIKAFREKF